MLHKLLLTCNFSLVYFELHRMFLGYEVDAPQCNADGLNILRVGVGFVCWCTRVCANNLQKYNACIKYDGIN